MLNFLSSIFSMTPAQSRWITTSAINKRSTEELVILGLCLVSVLALSPFMVFRVLNNEWFLAAINTALVSSTLVMMAFILITHRIRIASIVLTFCYTISIISVLHIKGISHIYWTYPAMAAAYFILKPREAAAINTMMLFAVLPVILASMPPAQYLVLLATLIASNLIAYIFAQQMNIHRAQLSELASHDPLTRTGNRHALEIRLQEAIATKQRREENIALIVIDVDDFKVINDSHGHHIGDDVLIRLADIMRTRIRITDGLYRFGGDEFVIILMSADIPIAYNFAEQLRALIENTQILADHTVTVSFGVTEVLEFDITQTLIKRADKALYQAKQAGRNRVKIVEEKWEPTAISTR
ncbi:MAG: GGDEF domain-containing protein [Chromatiales bacterium]|nr:GGDEF domain-containing protein [Chromatiales bacterium]